MPVLAFAKGHDLDRNGFDIDLLPHVCVSNCPVNSPWDGLRQIATQRISPLDYTHHFTVGATYRLPFGRRRMFDSGGSRIGDELLGGFVINSTSQFQTGAPAEYSADIPLQALHAI